MIKFLSTLTLVLAVPAIAQDATPTAPAVSSSATTSPSAPVGPVATLSPADAYKAQIVCRTEQETGSLVKKHKTCLTRKQWAYVNDQHENYARKMVDDNMGRPAGN